MPERHMYDGWSYDRLRSQRNRAHFLLENPYRFVTVLLHRGKIYAMDSPCYHASGPLGEGDVVEIEDAHETGPTVACLRCPWHGILVAVETGEEIDVLQPRPIGESAESSDALPSYPLRPHWERGGGGERPKMSRRGRVVQRTHAVWLDEAQGILTIEVEDEAVMQQRPVPSDNVSGDLKHGAIAMQIFDIKARGLDK